MKTQAEGKKDFSVVFPRNENNKIISSYNEKNK